MSKLSIKNKMLLSDVEEVKCETTLTIKREHSLNGTVQTTKLSDVLEFLPQGIIYKEETGMGATTLELMALRNSIIVEPTKITASSKAYSFSKKYGNEVLYVGSETKYHNKKATLKDIHEYINNPNIKYKKIMVVADSLRKVLEAVGENNYKDYFLMIDEIDSFQMDSDYREKMDHCIDLYKNYPETNRCVLSATKIPFSDTALIEENTTNIRFSDKSKRNISVITCNSDDLMGVTVDRVNELISDDPNAKILIAYNSIEGANSIAIKLLENQALSESDIKVLCSKNNKDNTPKFFAELDADVLPGKINFITSAYFTGFDLNESYHLISVSSVKKDFYTLSDKKLKQIAGRCRIKNGLLSETIIHDIDEKKTDKKYVFEDLINSSKTTIKVLNCMLQHCDKDPIHKEFQKYYANKHLNALKESKSFNVNTVRFDEAKNEFQISYLKVDAACEKNNVLFELFQNHDDLYKALVSEGHNVTLEIKSTQTTVNASDIRNLDKEKIISELITFLRDNPNDDTINKRIESGKYSSLKNDVKKEYLLLKPHIDNNQLLDLLDNAAKVRDDKKYRNLIDAAHYNILALNNPLRLTIDATFPIGKVLTKAEIYKLLKNNILLEGNTGCIINDENDALRFLHFCKKIILQRKNSKNPGCYKIVGDKSEKYNFKINKFQPSIEDIGKLSTKYIN
jgi:hypothetical protein